MRLALAVLTFASPAAAWEFSPSPICTLTHATEAAEVRVTYDARIPEYAIEISRRDTPWIPGPVFAIRFDGPRGLTISTDRHTFSDDNRALTAADSGFGNVLNGLEFNDTATALLTDQAVTIPLAGAAPEVQKFRACTEAPLA